jgi:pimeloyl-ACP methyl ester carboxylesterase
VSNYTQLGDVHTHYEEDGAGEPLVLLHPGLADSRAFEDYVPELAQHFHVFRPDRRGHGRALLHLAITPTGVLHQSP